MAHKKTSTPKLHVHGAYKNGPHTHFVLHPSFLPQASIIRTYLGHIMHAKNQKMIYEPNDKAWNHYVRPRLCWQFTSNQWWIMFHTLLPLMRVRQSMIKPMIRQIFVHLTFKLSVDSDSTAISGNKFQSFMTLWEKVWYLVLLKQRTVCIYITVYSLLAPSRTWVDKVKQFITRNVVKTFHSSESLYEVFIRYNFS